MHINEEQLSALLDGDSESTRDSDFSHIAADPKARAQWARYCLVGDVMRDAATDIAPPSFAQSLSEKIAAEPTALAPRTQDQRSRLHPVAGFAIAASVAALAIIGVRSMAPVATETNTVAVQSAPLRDAATDIAPPVVLASDRLNSQRRFNSYLVKFNEQRSSLGVPSVNPYVRIVGFESE